MQNFTEVSYTYPFEQWILDYSLIMKFSTRVFLLKDYFTFILFLLHEGEIRTVMVAFDDHETGIEAMAKHKYDEEIRKYSNVKGVPIFRQVAILVILMPYISHQFFYENAKKLDLFLLLSI